ncbi:TonB-dependent receptor [Sphingomonas sp. CJ99]
MNAVRAAVRLAASTLALASASAALGQEVDGDDIVVTAQQANETQVSRKGSLGVLGDKAAEDVPFSIRSYNEALIRNQQPQTLGQVLENDPAVRTTYAFGNAAELFVIRGFPLFGDDVGIDGLYGIAPRQIVAPELYDQVQVLNGASAFLNGAAPGGSGIGGSVNLLPKRAGEDLLRVTANYAEAGHFGGAFDAGRRFANGTVGVRINGAWRSGELAVDGEDRDTRVIGAAFDVDTGRFRASLDLAYQRVQVDRLRPKVQLGAGLTRLPSVPRADANYAQDWATTTLEDVFGIAKLEYDLSENAMLYARFGARDGSETGIYNSITVTDAATGAATGGGSFIPRTDNNEAVQAGLRVRLGEAVTHEINVGGDHLWQVNRNAYDFFGGFATNLYAPQDVAIPASLFAGGDLYEPYPITRVRQGSAFASDTIGLFDGRVLLTGGLRLQSITVKSYSYFGGAETGTYSEDAVTPVVGLVVKPVEGLSFYANRIEGLRQGPTAPVDVTLVNSGEVFAPFVSTQYEVGAKVSLGPVNASAAIYQIELPSAYAIADPLGSGLNRFGVYGTQRNRGIELALDGEVTPGLRVISGIAITDAVLRETQGGVNAGNKAAGIPEYTANANVEWDVPFIPALTLTGRVVHTGPQAVDVANTLELPNWTRFDLGARYVARVGEQALTLRVQVDNVANERYWASAFDSFAPQLLQGQPRTVKASASVEF